MLVVNFGSGWIAAFNGFTCQFIGFMRNPDNSLLTIDGVWSLAFGNRWWRGSLHDAVLLRRNQGRK